MAEIVKPDMSLLWASGGAIISPSPSKIQVGWTAEIPPHQWENWVQNRQDVAIGYLFQHGIPEWDDSTEYHASKSVVMRNGTLYMAVALNTNSDPELNPNNWVQLGNLFASQNMPLRGIQEYRTPGSYTWTVPSGTRRVKVTVTGGGGSGGGGTRAANGRGGGGGAGGTGIKLFDIPSGVTSIPITVGAGGNGTTGAGISGANSTFGPYITATGGVGGSATDLYNGGYGGTATTSTTSIITINGGDGHDGAPTSYEAAQTGGGNGGSSYWGGSGRGGSGGGRTATTPGAGGGGAGSTGSVSGAGAPGIVLIEW